MDYSLAGSRFVEIRFGLVADLPVQSPYTTPYYLSLTLRKGAVDFNEVYSISVLSPTVYLRDLGKIVKHRHRQDGKESYTFTDDSVMDIE